MERFVLGRMLAIRLAALAFMEVVVNIVSAFAMEVVIDPYALSKSGSEAVSLTALVG